jgi:hypothetical protein
VNRKGKMFKILDTASNLELDFNNSLLGVRRGKQSNLLFCGFPDALEYSFIEQ